MIAHLGLVILIVLFYEFFIFLNLKSLIKKNFKIYQNILKLFNLKKVSDHWKQKAILNYSIRLIFYSTKIILFLIIILILIKFLIRIDANFYNLIISFIGILETIIFFVIYKLLRKFIYEKL